MRRRCSVVKALLLAPIILSVLVFFKSSYVMLSDFLPSHSTDDLKVAIVTLNSGGDKGKYEEAMKNHQAYAECHGYDFINIDDAQDFLAGAGKQHVHPFMQKAFALKSVFTTDHNLKYDYILWMDRDAIFMNHEMSIGERLARLPTDNNGQYDLYIAVERWAWLNSGVLLFRNTVFSQVLIDDWIKAYESRQRNYVSDETNLIQGVPTMFRELFDQKWSCEDQGALIALLAGYREDDAVQKKWETDRFDGLGNPHELHVATDDWAKLSTKLLLHRKYQSRVKIVASKWLNTNPWNGDKESAPPFIYHFNGQRNKPSLIHEYSKEVATCKKQQIPRAHTSLH